ncbi:MAG: hypothetical protein WDM85_05585 [Caulobacteraceae bacterium]
MVDAVLRDLAAADYFEPAKIIAFDWQVLRLVREQAPELRTAHLTLPTPPVRDPDRPPSPWNDGCDPRQHGGSDLAAIKAHGGIELVALLYRRHAAAHGRGARARPAGRSLGAVRPVTTSGAWRSWASTARRCPAPIGASSRARSARVCDRSC